MSDLNQTHGVAGLKKYDMKVSGIVFMIYCLVAAGAFGIEEMIPVGGPGLTLVMLIIFPIIWALPISNLVAEMGSILPSEGGVYVWVKEAFGEFWGFQAGWWATISTYITNGVYVALVVGYTSQFIPMTQTTALIVKICMIGIFTFVNLMGIKEVGKVSTILSVLIIIAFFGIALVGFTNWNYNPVTPFIPEGKGLLESIGGCVGICVWMYCGYECISNMAGEVKNPQVIPKGLIIAMPLIALTYVLPTMGGLATIGQWQNWSTDGTVGYSEVLTQNLGHIWGYIFLVIAIISQCAIFNTYLASGSRGFFVLADDNLCPKFLVKVSKGRGVPYVGILSLAVVTMFLSQYDFKTLVMAEVVFMLALYIILPLAVIKIRKKIPVSERAGCYVIPGGKVGLYVFACLPIAIAVICLLISGTDYFLIGLMATATGPIFYIFLKRIYGGLSKNDPIKNPMNKKTKLAVGDTFRISAYCMIAGVFAIIGHFFLYWYEAEEAVAYYTDEYKRGLFSNFHGMLNLLLGGGIIVIIISILLFIIGKRIEPKEPQLKN